VGEGVVRRGRGGWDWGAGRGAAATIGKQGGEGCEAALLRLRGDMRWRVWGYGVRDLGWR
jgi:hypothetical protein